MRTEHPDYLEHRCDRLEVIRKSEFYNGELIYKMHGEGTHWYFSMISDWGGSFNTPISFCPYCGEHIMNIDNTEMILEGEEAKVFLEYVRKELAEDEKEDLRKCIEFYKKHEPKPASTEESK